VEGEIASTIRVSLEDESGLLLDSVSGTRNEFSFSGVTATTVRAVVANPASGNEVSSALINLDELTTSISISLPPDFFGAVSASGTASLKVFVRDSESNSFIPCTISIVTPHGSSQILIKTEQSEGVTQFSLPTDQWYAVLVESPGYEFYDSRDDPFMLQRGEVKELPISLHALSISPAPAELNICVSGGVIVPSGAVIISSPTGSKLAELSLYNGCVDFELQSGPVVVSTLLSNCTDVSQETTLNPGQNTVRIDAVCSGLGEIRAMVVGPSGVLTYNSTVTLWYSDGSMVMGCGPGGTLAAGQGGYTEFVAVDTSKSLYFMVTNLSGYLSYTSDSYVVAPGEQKSVVLEPTPAADSPHDFIFSGVSFPNPVMVAQEFSVQVSQILYGQTDVTDIANLTVGVAGEPCIVTGTTASCIAPSEPGEYDLALLAIYADASGVVVEELRVLKTGPFGVLVITPHMVLDTISPIAMDFDVTLNDLPVSLTASNVSVYYEDGGIHVETSQSLTGSSGLYTTQIDTPFYGKHNARIYAMKEDNGSMYEAASTVVFYSNPPTDSLTLESSIYPRILQPSDAFTIYARVSHDGQEIAALQNLYVTVNGQRGAFSWDSAQHAYKRSSVAPTYEGIYTAAIDLGGDSLGEARFYVIDTAKQQASQCAITDCADRPDVRKCVAEYNSGAQMESSTIACIESGWAFAGTETLHCFNDSEADRGDWDNSCRLDSADVATMQNFLNTVPGPSERNEYFRCGDMDNDGEVNGDDSECLAKVASGSWEGDVGDGTCSRPLHGGYCFDIRGDLPGDFNDDALFKADDVSTMQKAVAAYSAGVVPTERVISMFDFNGDGAISQADASCLDLIAGTGSVPESCLAVYNYNCTGLRGDLTSDGIISDIDLMIESWAVNGRLACGSCTDLNDDDICDEDDYLCIMAIAEHDLADQERYCISCIAKMTEMNRYGPDICHDGLDNDCDDLVDEDCTCDADFDCNRKRDIDSFWQTDDFQVCMYTTWRGWVWITEEELEDACTRCSHEDRWYDNAGCGTGSMTCVDTCSGDVEWVHFPDSWQLSCGQWADIKESSSLCCDNDGQRGADCGGDSACPDGYVSIGSTVDCVACCVPSPCTGCNGGSSIISYNPATDQTATPELSAKGEDGAPSGYCGDRTCNPCENTMSCPADCPAAPPV